MLVVWCGVILGLSVFETVRDEILLPFQGLIQSCILSGSKPQG